MRDLRIYISGKVTGMPLESVRGKFAVAKAFLESIGFEAVNPMESGLPADAPWEQHMVKDFEMLLSCDAIYMMSDWVESKGASIEHDIAKRLDIKMFFEEEVQSIARITDAIHDVTGLSLRDYSTRSRKRNVVYARMLFVHHCRCQGMTLSIIARHIHRNHSSVLHMLSAYGNDVVFNPVFRKMAMKVNDILNKSNTEKE
ncbi:MAG: DUF4406 domain-containing protein [Bacteroides sp.]|nr:DUF4406 domain-containing protein [Bacteroides sp.]